MSSKKSGPKGNPDSGASVASKPPFRSSLREADYIEKDWSDMAHPTKEIIALREKLKSSITQFTKSDDNFDAQSQLWTILNDLFWAYLTFTFRLPIDKLLITSKVELNESVQNVIFDVLLLIWNRIKSRPESDTPLIDRYEKLIICLQPHLDTKMMKLKLCKEMCNKLSLFKHIRMPKPRNGDGLQTLQNRNRTQTKFAQNKFNMLIEETEGYAKLLTELGTHLQEVSGKRIDPASTSVQNTFNDTVIQLIGQFKLDPNRVTDLILDAFENAPTDPCLRLVLQKQFSAKHIATILGFKLRQMPASGLYITAAHLVFYGVISLTDILPHLTPDLDAHTSDRKQYLENEEKLSKLLVHTNLNESESDKVKRMKRQKELSHQIRYYRINTLSSQTIELLRCFLRVGDWRDANELFSIAIDAHLEHKNVIYDELAKLLSRILRPLYDKHCKVWNTLRSARSHSQSTFLQSSLVCSKLEDIPAIIEPILEKAGMVLHHNTYAFSYICRLLNELLCQVRLSDSQLNLVKKCVTHLFASYSQMDYNLGAAEELWSVLSHFDYVFRFQCYGHWRSNVYSRTPEHMNIITAVTKNTKKFLKQYRSSNNSEVGQKMGSLLSVHPTIVFELVLEQLMSYSGNIGAVFKTGLEHVNHLDKDVLTWILIKQCENPTSQSVRSGRRGGIPKMENNACLASWFKALCEISSQVFSTFSDVDITPLIQYCVLKLKAGECDHISLLTSMIAALGGIKVETLGEDVSSEHVDAWAGSDTLKVRIFSLSDDPKNRSKSRSLRRFTQALDKHRLLVPLFILLAQQKDQLSFNPFGLSETPFAIVPKLIDDANDAFIQLFWFMRMQMLPHLSNLDRHFPSIQALVTKYQIAPDLALCISRDFLQIKRIVAWVDDDQKDTSSVATATATANDKDIEMKEKKEHDHLVPNLDLLTETCRRLLPNEVWNHITPELYACFHGVKVEDILLPHRLYTGELENVNVLMDRLEAEKKKSSSNYSRQRVNDKEDELKSLKPLHKELEKDYERLQVKYSKMLPHIRTKVRSWFKPSPHYEHTYREFLYRCVLPRLQTSDIDAKYTAEFIRLAVNERTPNFLPVHLGDQLIQNFNQIMSSSTSGEARRFGRFMSEFMALWEKYRADKPGTGHGAFNKFMGLPAAKHWRSSADIERSAVEKGKALSERDKKRNQELVAKSGRLDDSILCTMTHEDLCTKFRALHRSLTIHLVHLMQSDQELLQRNAVSFLFEVSKVFPKVHSHAKHLLGKVTALSKKARPKSPLQLLCERVRGVVDKNMQDGNYIDESQFGGRNLMPNTRAHMRPHSNAVAAAAAPTVASTATASAAASAAAVSSSSTKTIDAKATKRESAAAKRSTESTSNNPPKKGTESASSKSNSRANGTTKHESRSHTSKKTSAATPLSTSNESRHKSDGSVSKTISAEPPNGVADDLRLKALQSMKNTSPAKSSSRKTATKRTLSQISGAAAEEGTKSDTTAAIHGSGSGGAPHSKRRRVSSHSPTRQLKESSSTQSSTRNRGKSFEDSDIHKVRTIERSSRRESSSHKEKPSQDTSKSISSRDRDRYHSASASASNGRVTTAISTTTSTLRNESGGGSSGSGSSSSSGKDNKHMRGERERDRGRDIDKGKSRDRVGDSDRHRDRGDTRNSNSNSDKQPNSSIQQSSAAINVNDVKSQDRSSSRRKYKSNSDDKTRKKSTQLSVTSDDKPKSLKRNSDDDSSVGESDRKRRRRKDTREKSQSSEPNRYSSSHRSSSRRDRPIDDEKVKDSGDRRRSQRRKNRK